MLKFISFIMNLVERITNHHLSAYAAQAAFFTVLSFFPFIIALMSIVPFFPISTEDITKMILSVIPEVFIPYVKPIIVETLTNATGTVLSVSLITALWCAAKGIMSMKNGFNTITDYRKSNNYFVVRINCAIYTMFFAFAIVFMIVVMLFGNRILHLLMKENNWFADIAVYFGTFRVIIVICVLLLFFILFYKFLPDYKDTVVHCMPGAFFSTFGWILISLAFSIFIDNFNNFALMYGSLAGIALTLLWLYFCMYILFIGRELNEYLFGKDEEAISYIPD